MATKAVDTEAACQSAVVLMGGSIERWMDSLEVQGNATNSFIKFKKLFINQYTPLDEKNSAWYKLYKL